MDLFKVTDKKLFKRFGKYSYIRNGVGYGFISNDYLYDNCLIEIGIGRVISGRGDWGGGAEYASDSPLKITIDKNFIIKKVETSSFYNSRESQRVENIAKRYSKRLKIGKKFIIRDEVFNKHVTTILNFIPCKTHIGHDVFGSPHMLSYFTDSKDKNRYSSLPEPKIIKNLKV